MLRVVCAWCGETTGWVDGPRGVSHGICARCRDLVEEEGRRLARARPRCPSCGRGRLTRRLYQGVEFCLACGWQERIPVPFPEPSPAEPSGEVAAGHT